MSADEAMVSVWDHGLLYGDAVFEGIRAHGGHVFRCQEHLERLWRSAHTLQMVIPLSRQELTEVVLETLRRNHLEDAHLKVLVTRGIAPMGMDPRGPSVSSVLVYAYPYPPILGTTAVRLITASLRRKSPHSVDARIKSVNYLENVLAKLQAIAAGADDALMLDTDSFVAEATAANVFVVSEGQVCTPFCHAALAGITRKVVLGCANARGYEPAECNLTLYDLYNADEVFLTGTAAGIVPVASIDGRVIGASRGTGEITRELTEAYYDVVAAEGSTASSAHASGS